jgi:hypothetical protein
MVFCFSALPLGFAGAKQNRFCHYTAIKNISIIIKSICLQTVGLMIGTVVAGRSRCFIVKIGVKCICLNSWYVFVPNTLFLKLFFNLSSLFDRTVLSIAL